MTRPDSFFRIVQIVLELYRRKWQGGNIYFVSRAGVVVVAACWLVRVIKCLNNRVNVKGLPT